MPRKPTLSIGAFGSSAVFRARNASLTTVAFTLGTFLIATLACTSNERRTTSVGADDAVTSSAVIGIESALHGESVLPNHPRMASKKQVRMLAQRLTQSATSPRSKRAGVRRTAARTAPVSSAASENAASVAPPLGWEVPPPIEKKTSTTKKGAAACCGYDQLCCSRQTDIDRGIRKPASRVLDVRFTDVPDAVIKEATKGGPPLEGVPDVRVVDGTGAPFPWPDGPKQFEIRIIPPGGMGYIRFGKDSSGTLYEKPEHRTLGYGVTAPILDTPDRGRSLVAGPIEYWTYARGEGDKLIHDHVKGKLEGSPKVIAERWVHVNALNAAEGIVHAYRATYEDKPYVFFVLPETVLGFESKDAVSFGGTNLTRFASDFPYTLYKFPVGPGRSNTISCMVREYEIRRWFDRPKGAMKLAEETSIFISMSQTSVESEPRIRIMLL